VSSNRFLQSAVIPTFYLLIVILTSKSLFGAKEGIEQIPSESTDYPGNNPDVIKVNVTGANKDPMGHYRVIGVIKNLDNKTLEDVMVTGHFFDDKNQTVGVTECCYTNPTDIQPGHTATFDSFVSEEDITGTPTSFKLSFNWTSNAVNLP
jgi:hypothetical protein